MTWNIEYKNNTFTKNTKTRDYVKEKNMFTIRMESIVHGSSKNTYNDLNVYKEDNSQVGKEEMKYMDNYVSFKS